MSPLDEPSCAKPLRGVGPTKQGAHIHDTSVVGFSRAGVEGGVYVGGGVSGVRGGRGVSRCGGGGDPSKER